MNFIEDHIVRALGLMMMISLPILGTGVIVGLFLGILQAASQIQESMISYVGKLCAVSVVLFLVGGWAMAELQAYSQEVLRDVVSVQRE